MSTTSLKSACLTIGLVSAWAPAASADLLSEVQVQTNLTNDLSHAQIMIGGLGSGGNIADPLLLTNLSLPGTGSGDYFSDRPPSDLGDSYALVAIASGTGSGGDGSHLIVSFAHLTVIYDLDFAVAFPGWTEPQVIDQLLTGNTQFIQSNFATMAEHLGSDAAGVLYSSGVPAGTLNIQVFSVPTPAAVFALPLLALGRRRRS